MVDEWSAEIHTCCDALASRTNAYWENTVGNTGNERNPISVTMLENYRPVRGQATSV